MIKIVSTRKTEKSFLFSYVILFIKWNIKDAYNKKRFHNSNMIYKISQIAVLEVHELTRTVAVVQFFQAGT